MLANFLIGLREGLEASLIVGILVAYCIKSGRKAALPGIFWGTLIAVLFSIGVGVLLTEFVEVAPAGINEVIAGFASILAVVFVTWMIFWMARQSKNMRKELHEKIDQAGEKNITLILVAFFAVIREGIETAVFLWSASRATGSDTNPVLGASLGLAIAAVLGYLVYRGALKLNLSKFFQVTGAFLIIVAAGILAYGIHELQEIGWFPFLTQTTYDLSGVITPDSWIDTLLRGTISFRSAPSMLESVFWFGYVAIVGWLFLKPAKVKTN